MEQGSQPRTIDLLSLLVRAVLGVGTTEQSKAEKETSSGWPYRSDPYCNVLLYREAYLYHDCVEKDKGH